jgi:hypothetical protein
MSTKNQARLRVALYVAVLLGAMLLDSAAFGAMHLTYVPCVMPVAVCCIGLWVGMEQGCTYGLVGGLLWALSGALSMYSAWRVLVLTLVGLLSGLLAQQFLLQGWKTALSFSLPAVFLCDGLYVLFLSATGTLPAGTLFSHFVPACIISLVFCGIFYPITRFISRIGGFHG